MPEGPEVRKYADALDSVLTGRVITSLEARTREARDWLKGNAQRLTGQRVERVISHGKHLIGYIEGGFFFHSHLMMWGRWQTFAPAASGFSTKNRKSRDAVQLLAKDRRERARIVVNGGAAILLSAPIFNVGEGDPYEKIANLSTLGPDVLPYNRRFQAATFRQRLLSSEHRTITIGAALLNQQIVAGLGNYLRAEVLFACKLDPWRKVDELTGLDLRCLSRSVPYLSRRSYEKGATASEKERARMTNDAALVYQPNREYGTRHLVFRRTNLPCLRCGEKIRQLRQPTYNPEPEDQEERTRIVYFCAKCQKVRMSDI